MSTIHKNQFQFSRIHLNNSIRVEFIGESVYEATPHKLSSGQPKEQTFLNTLRTSHPRNIISTESKDLKEKKKQTLAIFTSGGCAKYE